MPEPRGQAPGSGREWLAWAPAILVMLVVTATVFGSGGFTDSSRFILVLIGAVGYLLSAIRSPERLAPVISTVPVLGLLGLTLVGLFSLLWTDAATGTALLVALAPATYAGITVFAACDSRLRERQNAIGNLVGLLAFVAATTGLIGVMFELDPWAFQLGGRLRPAGFIEYPPALAFLQLAAMPTLARLVGSSGRLNRHLAGMALITGAAVIFLAESRVVLLLAFFLLAAWAAWPDRLLGLSRRKALLPVSLWICGGFLVSVSTRLFDGWPALILAVALVLSVPWCAEKLLSLFRGSSRRLSSNVARLFPGGAVLGALLVVFLVLPVLADPSSEGVQVDQGVDHGRIELWSDSARAIGEQPLLGHGQGSFLNATLEFQESPMRFAHSLVVESAVELGLVGGLLSILVLLSPMGLCWKLRNDTSAWVYIPAVVGFCALALVDWTWHLVGVGAVWALCLGMILVRRDQNHSANT